MCQTEDKLQEACWHVEDVLTVTDADTSPDRLDESVSPSKKSDGVSHYANQVVATIIDPAQRLEEITSPAQDFESMGTPVVEEFDTEKLEHPSGVQASNPVGDASTDLSSDAIDPEHPRSTTEQQSTPSPGENPNSDV